MEIQLAAITVAATSEGVSKCSIHCAATELLTARKVIPAAIYQQMKAICGNRYSDEALLNDIGQKDGHSMHCRLSLNLHCHYRPHFTPCGVCFFLHMKQGTAKITTQRSQQQSNGLKDGDLEL